MTRTESRVACPHCGGPNNHLKHALAPDKTPLTEDCKLCGGRGSVPRSVATDYAVEQYEAHKRALRGKHG